MEWFNYHLSNSWSHTTHVNIKNRRQWHYETSKSISSNIEKKKCNAIVKIPNWYIIDEDEYIVQGKTWFIFRLFLYFSLSCSFLMCKNSFALEYLVIGLTNHSRYCGNTFCLPFFLPSINRNKPKFRNL